MTLNEKFTRLRDLLGRMDNVIIAYSGGVDSTLLLKAATLSGLRKILAVTASSASLPGEELSFAKEMTSALDIDHMLITTDELQDDNYTSNSRNRCYHCKKELFGKLKDIAVRKNISFLLDGTNADDLRDWRPGLRAAREAGVRSPLADVNLGKREIRDLSRVLGLPTWDKAATPCLSSRFPYGQTITFEALERVDRAERIIRGFGVTELRVRNHGDTARIEMRPAQFRLIMGKEVRNEIVNLLKGLGYKYITLDLQGFRSGSLNE